MNHITPERVAAAARLVRRGKTINLNLPLNLPYPALSGAGRAIYDHHIEVRRGGRDDSLDRFYLQASSQWDGLRHIRYREFGYWGGLQEEDVDEGRLGIDAWARRGIVGRAVLIDLPRHLERRGEQLDVRSRYLVTGAQLEEIAAAQGVAFEAGDVLLLRTGWMGWYLGLDQAGRDALQGTLHPNEGGLVCPGLDPARETAAWLWDHRIAAVAADTATVEALQIRAAEGFLHRRILPLLGMGIGEFWYLEELADDCASDGVYEAMLVSAPLNLPGGVGSPANAYAIK
jgi:kynurenine formamidase